MADYQKMYYVLLKAVDGAIKAEEEGNHEGIMDILICGKQKAEELYMSDPGGRSQMWEGK